jgi:hypothetical protein
MNDAKYIGMDVHQATICAAVRDSSGNLVMEATLDGNATHQASLRSSTRMLNVWGTPENQETG